MGWDGKSREKKMKSKEKPHTIISPYQYQDISME